MKKYLYTIVLLFACLFHQAQTSQDKAKAFYQEAVKAFDNKNPAKALDYCQKVIGELQTTNARVELLKIKSYYELDQIDNAKASLKTFLDLPSEEQLKQEGLRYLVKIEDRELVKIKDGGLVTQASVDAGETNPTIEVLKKQIAENPENTDVLFKLANAYQEVKNWKGAILSWQKMSGLLPDWAPAYYSQGYAQQLAGNSELAAIAYEKYISSIKPEEVEGSKEILSYAYFAVAFLAKEKNPVKAKDYVNKSIMLNPNYKDALDLKNNLK